MSNKEYKRPNKPLVFTTAFKLIPIGIGATLFSLMLLAITFSFEEKIIIADIEIPEELEKKGYTANRIEQVIQQSIQRAWNSDDNFYTMEEKLDDLAALREGVEVATRFEPLSYQKSFTEVRDRPLSIVVPGQSLSASLLARQLAGMLPWSSRQTIVTIQILSVQQERINLQLVARASDNGTSISRIEGNPDALIDPKSTLMQSIGLRILEKANPEKMIRALIAEDLRSCTCISEKTTAALEDAVPNLSNAELAVTLFKINFFSRFNRIYIGPISEHQILRIVYRAKQRSPTGPWDFLTLPLEEFERKKVCERLPTEFLAVSKTSDEKKLSNLVGRHVVFTCYLLSEQTKQAIQFDTHNLIGAYASTEMSAMLVPSVFSLAIYRPELFSPYKEKIKALYTKAKNGDLKQSLQTLSALLERRHSDLIGYGLNEIYQPFTFDCEIMEQDECLLAWQQNRSVRLRIAGLAAIGVDEEGTDKAVELCNIALSLIPKDPDNASCLARALLRSGDLNSSEYWLRRAHRALVGREPEDQVPEFMGAKELDSFKIRLELANVLIGFNEFDNASRLLESSLAQNRLIVTNLLASLAARQCNEKKLSQLIGPDWGDSPAGKVLSARKLIQIGKIEDAKRIAIEIMASSENSKINVDLGNEILVVEAYSLSQGHLLMGMTAMVENNIVDARASFARALKYDQNNIEARQILALVKTRSNTSSSIKSCAI